MIDKLYQHFLKSTGVSTDTRNVKSGEIFFALNGPNFNANKFAQQAIRAGAMLAVVDDEAYAPDEQYYLVNDSLEALQQLANYHRKAFDIPLIGITGSNGKTTTKELMRDVLAKKYRVLATVGNLNNHIGVPLTILSINSGVEIAIIEMGANHIGEIEALCKIAEPTHGLITNVGKAHLDGFGGVEGVVRGKSELYNYLIQHEGVIYVNSQNEVLSNMAKRMIKSPIYYAADGESGSEELISAIPFVQYQSGDSVIDTSLSGRYNFENIMAALCVGKFFGVQEINANQAVSDYVPNNNRSQLIERGGVKIILDAYNANPSSMKVALENLANLEGKKTVILGDMYELGAESEKAHQDVGLQTSELKIDLVIFCGELMKTALAGNSDGLYFETKDALATYLKDDPITSDYLLIKGSRGMGLETILDTV